MRRISSSEAGVCCARIDINDGDSLTTTPMMCARLLGRDRHRKPNAFARSFKSNFESMREGYERTLGFALNHPLLTMLSLVATIVLNVYLYTAIPAGFFPQQDTGQLQGGMRGDATASFGMIKGKLQQVTKIIQRIRRWSASPVRWAAAASTAMPAPSST